MYNFDDTSNGINLPRDGDAANAAEVDVGQRLPEHRGSHATYSREVTRLASEELTRLEAI